MMAGANHASEISCDEKLGVKAALDVQPLLVYLHELVFAGVFCGM